jgi:putative tricarboxylic transport membrane protein
MGSMKRLRTFLLSTLALVSMTAGAAHPLDAECLIPSKPGGAMDLTCKLAQKGLHDEAGAPQLKLSYLPGGVGAVAWHTMVSQRRSEPNT